MGRETVIFLDKDGTLVQNVPYNVDPSRMVLEEGAAQGLQRLAQAGCRFVVVSNQAGVARGYFAEAALRAVEARLRAMLQAEAGVSLAGFYYCPHHPEGTVSQYAVECDCRKPRPGMLLQAAQDLDIDLRQAWMIGDILNDVEAGNRAGCRTILLDNGSEMEWQSGPFREPDFICENLSQAAGVIVPLIKTEEQDVSQNKSGD